MILAGLFQLPGATPEADGNSEIEIGFALGGDSDTVILKETNVYEVDQLIFAANGIDVGGDGNEDITTAGVEVVKLYGIVDVDPSARPRRRRHSSNDA